MPHNDLRTDLIAAKGISATLSGATPAKGNIVDLQGIKSATFVEQTGTVTDAGTASGFSTEIQESDTTADGDFTAVADADLIGLESALTVTSDSADDDIIGTIGYRGSKRYVRAVVTGTTGSNAVVNGIWILEPESRLSALSASASYIAADVAAT